MAKQRLIDANEIPYHKSGFPKGDGFDSGLDWAFREDIEKLPTIDAVEVVRCKDCKHYVQFLQDNKECLSSGLYCRPPYRKRSGYCKNGNNHMKKMDCCGRVFRVAVKSPTGCPFPKHRKENEYGEVQTRNKKRQMRIKRKLRISERMPYGRVLQMPRAYRALRTKRTTDQRRPHPGYE
jgi:hypothetical protein